jgi:hypothetical protein
MAGGENRVARNGIRRWLAVVGLLGVSALSPASAWAQSIGAGTFEWTMAAGGGASLSKDDLHLETVTSFHVLPHVGYFVTGEVGQGAGES